MCSFSGTLFLYRCCVALLERLHKVPQTTVSELQKGGQLSGHVLKSGLDYVSVWCAGWLLSERPLLGVEDSM